MHPKNLSFLLIVLLFFVQLAEAQNNTNSPYTRFGFGELVDSYSGEQKSLGGTGIGLRRSFSINTMNPASYSAVDSLTFMFDMGLSGLLSSFRVPEGSNTKFNSNLEYVTMQFPLSKSLGFSMGLLPYSFTGYSFFRKDSVLMPATQSPQYTGYTESYSGDGGISQVYGGLAMKLFNFASVGVNAYYMFGEVANNRNIVFNSNQFSNSSATQVNALRVQSFRFRYGLQLFQTFADKHEVTFGAIYESKAKLNGDFVQMHYAIPSDTVVYENDFEVPQTFGAGLFYTFDNRLSFALDYSLQQWGNAKYFGVTDSLSNRSKIAFGAEYIANPRGNRYSDRVRYRMGFNITDPYYKLAGFEPVKNIGISFGVGLPLRTSNTMVNATVEYGKSGQSSLLREDYFKFTFNAAFNENWFFKRKL